MKTKTIIFLILLLIVLLLSFLYFIIQPSIVHLETVTSGTAVFQCDYDGVNSSVPISSQDLAVLTDMFRGKVMSRDNPSCGFSEDVCVILNDEMTFCFACDTCPIILWKEKGKYFSVTKKEQAELYDLLETYGFHFPCL